MDVRDTFKAGETEARSWLRSFLIAHPFVSVLTALILGLLVGHLL